MMRNEYMESLCHVQIQNPGKKKKNIYIYINPLPGCEEGSRRRGAEEWHLLYGPAVI